MALKTFKPVTPGLRQLVNVDRSGLHKGKPLKQLTEGKPSTGGRNNNGRITVRFRGGGHKQSYRIVDFKRRKLDIPAKVERIEYDPNRTSFVALIRYADGEGAETRRTIWPFAVGFFERARVVVAWCEMRTAFRHFRTDRIAALTLSETRYPRRRLALMKEWREVQGIALDKKERG